MEGREDVRNGYLDQRERAQNEREERDGCLYWGPLGGAKAMLLEGSCGHEVRLKCAWG